MTRNAAFIACLPLLTALVSVSRADGDGGGYGGGSFDGDPTLDLPVDPPAPLSSAIAALFTQTNVRYPLPRKPGDHPTVPPPVQPTPDGGGPRDDPRDEPPPVFFGEEIDSENATIVYVIDCSGSMNYKDRIGHAKQELLRSIDGLSPNFWFNVVNYHCAITQLFPRLVEADERNKALAKAYVATLRASGGTGTGPAVARALSDKDVMAIALLTDGGPNCGADGFDGHRRMIRNANTQQATINVFGVDADGDLRGFCMNVAADSGGSYFDVPIAGSSRGKK